MNTLTKTLTISFLLFCFGSPAQSVSHVYKINGLLNRIKHPDTTYVVNFWATWCKPCIQELPSFDSLYTISKNQPVKILLVTLDFKEDMEKKTNPFLVKKQVQSECILLDEVNGNDFINQIDPKWSGAIPATLIKRGDKRTFLEKKTHLKELQEQLITIKN